MAADAEVGRVFRESFLRRFRQPEHQAALRVLDDVAYSLVMYGRGVIDRPDGTAGSWMQWDMRGAIADLRQAIAGLHILGEWIDEAELNRAESRLSLAAGDTAAELKPFAARLDKALTRYLGEDRSRS